jgi:hypothetical protein
MPAVDRQCFHRLCLDGSVSRVDCGVGRVAIGVVSVIAPLSNNIFAAVNLIVSDAIGGGGLGLV